MKSWRIGLVGTGYWSDKHLKAWRRIPNVEIAGLCNRSRPKLEARGREFGVPPEALYNRLEHMLSDANIDIVDIVTGPETHSALVGLAAAHGKHILCQKPFARSMAEAEQMVNTAAEAGVRLMVAENWRWLQPFQFIKQTLTSGALGKLHAARYVHTDYYTPRMAPEAAIPQPFFRDMPRLLFFEMGAHWFDTWRFLFGTPRRLYAETARISPYIQGEDAGIVTLGHDDFYGFLDMSWATRHMLDKPPGQEVAADHLEQMAIDGDQGTLKLYADGRITLINRNGTAERLLAASTELDHEESHYRLQSHFIACLETGREFATSGADNLITLQMVFGTYQSAHMHAPVRIGLPTGSAGESAGASRE